MPAAVAVPLALAGASLISGNSQQKAADKNNQNQQTASVQNAQQAAQQAQQLYNSYAAAHPSPFGTPAMQRPNMAQNILQPSQGSSAPALAAAPRLALPAPQSSVVNAILG